MKRGWTYIGLVVAGICLPVLEGIFAFLVIPFLSLPGVERARSSFGQAIMWFCWMTPIFLIGLALGHERPMNASKRPAILLAIGLIISAPIISWLVADDVQGGIKMEPAWARDEQMWLLRHLLWNSLAAVTTLFAGSWLGDLVARMRLGKRQA